MMIPDIETILEDLAAGRISTAQATAWLYRHAEGADSDLRDHFAGLSMPLAMDDYRRVTCKDGEELSDWLVKGDLSIVAARAYALADAMLSVRSAR